MNLAITYSSSECFDVDSTKRKCCTWKPTAWAKSGEIIPKVAIIDAEMVAWNAPFTGEK